jgi:hypothetical protein
MRVTFTVEVEVDHANAAQVRGLLDDTLQNGVDNDVIDDYMILT